MKFRFLHAFVIAFTLSGIGILSQTPIEEINLGMNKLSGLPIEFGRLSTLKTLWLDDNEFEKFPTSLCQLKVRTDELCALKISKMVILYALCYELKVL